MTTEALRYTTAKDWPLWSRGKAPDAYDLGDGLLIAATDRIWQESIGWNKKPPAPQLPRMSWSVPGRNTRQPSAD